MNHIIQDFLYVLMNHYRVLGVYKKYDWLTGVHIHVGSQGLPLELFVKAARVTCKGW